MDNNFYYFSREELLENYRRDKETDKLLSDYFFKPENQQDYE
jgi:hypothetical protein